MIARIKPWLKRRKTVWEIRPHDIIVPWTSTEVSWIVYEGWEPFGVSAVPNTTNHDQIRLWTRRPENSKQRRSYEIKIQSAGWGGHQIVLHLSEGWEPFGVSDSLDNHIIWFRRRAVA